MKLRKKASTANRSDQPSRRKVSTEDTDVQYRTSSQDISERYAFRRNRTITGSSSAKIMSSNELNAEVRSPRAHVHHLSSLRRRLLMYFGAIVALAFGLYILLAQTTASEFIQVKDVPVISDQQEELYRASIEEYYTARPTERLRFLLDEDRIVSHMQASHPEIKDLSINQTGIGEASVVIRARTPIARWNVSSVAQYVDGDGVVFTNNYFKDPALQIIDNTGLQADANQAVASNRFLGFIGRLLSSAEERSLSVSKVTLPVGTTRQVEVVFTGKATRYKVTVDRSARQQVEDIHRISSYLSKRAMNPGYVDVRLEGKAYYR